jgi:ABC-type antimicrobial peptide transport system permease subunit
MIVSMPSFTGDFLGGMDVGTWGMIARGFTYMVLPDHVTPQSIDSRLDPFVKKYCQTEDLKNVVMNLQPLREIHFDPEYTKTPSRVTNIAKNDLVMMGILGVFILGIACINFINLATASSEKKAKEIGIRKTLGAQRRQLAAYFLSETFLLSLIAVLISLGAAEWLLVWLNPFLEKEISINLFSNGTLVVFLIGLIAGTTLLAGLYPATFLSRYSPTDVLKSRFSIGGSKTSVRKVLVVFQFVIAQVLIIGTVVVARQMTYFKSKPLGFEKEAIVNVPVPERDVTKQETLRARLETNANIRNITFSVGAPVSNNDYYTDFFLTEKGRGDGAFGTGLKGVDRHYLETYKIKLLAGRWFNESDERKSDIRLPESEQKFVYVVNESAVKQLGFHTPEEIIGKFITSGFFQVNSEVVGVVQDFHISSLHKQIVPVIFVTSPYLYYEAGIQLNTTNLSETIKYIEKQWNEVYPDQFFEYQFLDEHLATLYKNDEKTFMLFKIFAGVSIFIGCLGLYGLISFVANQKQKEVGIRKVMGASVPSIVILFIGDFAKLVVIAFVLAAPLTWYAMNQWLQSFAYRTDISWWIFLVGFVVTTAIVLLTILYRSVRAAQTNPVTTLRTE